MRITGICCRRFTMNLKKPIKVASGEITSGDTVLVRLDTDTGLYGLGEGSGVPFVTGEDCGDVLAGAEKLAEAALGRSPFEIQAVHAAMDAIYTHHTAAKAAIDIALFDLMAKAAGLPLYRFLGGTNPLVETDKTITLASPSEMAAEAAELAAVFRGLDGKYRLSDIGIDEALEPEILDISAAIRNRLTLARMRRVLDFEE